MTYPNGAKKAFTLSYDDAVNQDKRFIDIINKYNLKCTFNVNSGLIDSKKVGDRNGVKITRMTTEDVLKVYEGHEVACHGLMHDRLTEDTYEEKVHEITQDKINLEKLFGREIPGMAYAYGKVDDESIEIMKNCGIKYGRTVIATHRFDLPKDLYNWETTCHHRVDEVFDLIEEYKNLDQDELSVFYLWGHTYEFDTDDNWDKIEKICQEISGLDDIWYCTNIELVNFLESNK